MKKHLPSAVFTSCLFACLPSTGFAQTDYIWDLNGDGLWRLDGNWDQTGFPSTSTDNAFIRNTTTATDGVVVTLSGSTDVSNLTIDDSGTVDQNTLIIANNTFLDVWGDITNNGIISLEIHR